MSRIACRVKDRSAGALVDPTGPRQCFSRTEARPPQWRHALQRDPVQADVMRAGSPHESEGGARPIAIIATIPGKFSAYRRGRAAQQPCHRSRRLMRRKASGYLLALRQCQCQPRATQWRRTKSHRAGLLGNKSTMTAYRTLGQSPSGIPLAASDPIAPLSLPLRSLDDTLPHLQHSIFSFKITCCVDQLKPPTISDLMRRRRRRHR